MQARDAKKREDFAAAGGIFLSCRHLPLPFFDKALYRLWVNCYNVHREERKGSDTLLFQTVPHSMRAAPPPCSSPSSICPPHPA